MKQKKQETDGKFRVAVYCRFNHALQEHDASFELQKMSFLQRIESTPNWELADIYADLGVSGARKEPGPEFCRMMEDCKAGKVDIRALRMTVLFQFTGNAAWSAHDIRG